MSDIKSMIKKNRNQDVKSLLETHLKNLKEEGFDVEFGKIGIHTTFALLYNEDHSDEIVGYTFLRDMRYYDEDRGHLKALQQAIARKSVSKKEE